MELLEEKLENAVLQGIEGEELEGAIEPEGGEYTPAEPFDPSAIGIFRKTFTLDNVVKRMHRKSIILAPPYQRKEVWNDVKKSQLIESLLLRIPLPSFYVAEDDEGNYEVVDGQQRLSAIRDFFFSDGVTATQHDGNGLRLQELEFLPELKNPNYIELNDYFKQNLEETQLDFIIIDNNTPEDVKFVIFSRINRGGLALNDQEVRHALYNGISTKLLENLAEEPLFRNNFSGYFPAENMLDREVILRALAFMVRSFTDFTKDARMPDFLSETMLIINSMPTFSSFRFQRKFNKEDTARFEIKDADLLTERFQVGIMRSLEIFGKHTFRRSIGDARKSRVNKALFEVWIALLSKLHQEEYEVLISKKDEFLSAYAGIMEEESFKRAISSNALTMTGVINRYQPLDRIINHVLKT